jgi:hypothetical protein
LAIFLDECQEQVAVEISFTSSIGIVADTYFFILILLKSCAYWVACLPNILS